MDSRIEGGSPIYKREDKEDFEISNEKIAKYFYDKIVANGYEEEVYKIAESYGKDTPLERIEALMEKVSKNKGRDTTIDDDIDMFFIDSWAHGFTEDRTGEFVYACKQSGCSVDALKVAFNLTDYKFEKMMKRQRLIQKVNLQNAVADKVGAK